MCGLERFSKIQSHLMYNIIASNDPLSEVPLYIVTYETHCLAVKITVA